MNASALRIPHVPSALIPLIDTILEGARTEPLHRHSKAELQALCHGVALAAAEFGPDSEPTRRLLLILGLEHARAEALPATNERTQGGIGLS